MQVSFPACMTLIFGFYLKVHFCKEIQTSKLISYQFVSSGDLAFSIVKGPLEAIAGVVYGIVAGVIIWYLPNRASVCKIVLRFFLFRKLQKLLLAEKLNLKRNGGLSKT